MSAGKLIRRLKDVVHWLPGNIAESSIRAGRRRRMEYIILCFVDHFEPSWGKAEETQATVRLKRWVDDYPKRAASVYDCTGRTLPHSWFYPFDEARPTELSGLSQLVFDGWGEIDLQLHHFHDTPDGLRQKLSDAIQLYGRYGALRDATGKPSFGFIHGNWALGNSIPEYCGVDGELPILREAGCFGDFTFPAPNRCQPRRTNRIYAASERGSRPFEYGSLLTPYPAATLPIVQGPLRAGRLAGRWRIDDGEVDAHNPFFAERFAVWSSAGVTVRPRSRWGFVKIFTHGAPEHSADHVLDEFLPQLPEVMKKVDIPVVFATAREFLNMAYANAAGKTGNPADYRDAYIPPPLGRQVWAEGGTEIRVGSEGELKLDDIGAGNVSLASASGGAITLTGELKSLTWDKTTLRLACSGDIRVSGSVAAPDVVRGTGAGGRYQPDDRGELWLRW